MSPSIKFSNVNTFFSKSLRVRVNEYFKVSGKSKTGDWRVGLKAAILFASFIGLYTLLIFVQPYWPVSILLCLFLGLNFAAIGFNIMHDAGHNSFSRNTKINTILSYSLNLVGGNIYFWKLKHNIAHHTYTNIEGEDHDIEIKFMRVHPDQPVKGYHKCQRYYFIFLYGVSYLAWIFFQDYEKYFRQKLGKNSERFAFPLKERVIFWISKMFHFGIFIVIPVIVVGWLPTLVGLLVAGLLCGICLATVFQLAHVVEETEFKSIVTDKLEEEWMAHQVQSTANFATRNKVLTWLLGGLNFQVEHHLFPKICHVHYPAINRIVKETCKELGIKNIEYETFREAFKSHIRVIHSLSH
ncbi:acyl-CoA desaturase [Sphingobacterium sp. InxBP1]|uniref:fatty acid desaturase family protein n=1 Tax=Sphingobacterium sp. InxBP1 TaxID=2870328 RepID=UPI002244463D|nr:acyl-CoA desaturase [Sphingobacterium sp. InxBP1]MCW8309945.1 acyl-CoA desaturase [Sphingobacterium sp. InxBP1]